MRNSRFTITILLILVFAACQSNEGTAPPQPSEDTNIPLAIPRTDSPTQSWTEEFITLVNNHRTSIGLHALIHSEGLAEISSGHSTQMAQGILPFGHDGFSSRCSEGREFLGGGNWCAENVAMGQKTPEAAFNAWMNSSGHRANIESSRATHTGFGYAKNSKDTYYWTQIFLEMSP